MALRERNGLAMAAVSSSKGAAGGAVGGGMHKKASPARGSGTVGEAELSGSGNGSGGGEGSECGAAAQDHSGSFDSEQLDSLFELSSSEEWSVSSLSHTDADDDPLTLGEGGGGAPEAAGYGRGRGSFIGIAEQPPTAEEIEQLEEHEAGGGGMRRRMTIGHNDNAYIDKIESFAWKQSMSDFSTLNHGSASSPRKHAFEEMLKKKNEEFLFQYQLNSMLRSLSMGISQGAITKLALSQSMGATTAGPHGIVRRPHSATISGGRELDRGSASSPSLDVDDLIRSAEATTTSQGTTPSPSSPSATSSPSSPTLSIPVPASPRGLVSASPRTGIAPASPRASPRLTPRTIRELDFSGDIRSSPMNPRHDVLQARSQRSASDVGSARARQLSISEPAASAMPKLELSANSLSYSDAQVIEEADERARFKFDQAGSVAAAVTSDAAAKPPSAVDVVNDVSFNMSSKLTPRKKGTVHVELHVQNASHTFLDYAMRYFDVGKARDAKDAKKKAKVKRYIVAEKKLRSPLHPFQSPEQRDAALGSFESILSYCKLRGKHDPDTECFNHIRDVIRVGLRSSALRDEIYSQLIKQTTQNKKTGTFVWEIFASCLGCFVPGEKLYPYLSKYLEESLSEGDEDHQEWAKFCINRLEKMQGSCKRTYPPTDRELQFVLKRKAMLTQFRFCNGKLKQVPIYSSTTVCEALEFLCAMMGLQDREGYSIFEVYEIDREDGMREHVERSLLLNEHVSNSLYKFEVYLDVMSKERNPTAELVVKRKLFLSRTINGTDKGEISLMFDQLTAEIERGRLPCNPEDAEILTALRLQAIHGALTPEKKPDIEKECLEFVPSSLQMGMPDHDWSGNILDQYSSMSEMGQDEARLYFLRYCAELPFYGYQLFSARYCPDVISWDMPTRIRIGVNVAGVHFLHRNSKESYHNFTFGEIVSFHASPHNLLLSFFTGRSVTFYTNHGDEIVSLIIDYKHHELSKVAQSGLSILATLPG